MTERMKLLIAYDGSECSDEALADLRRAGLPGVADATVITVADVFVPPPVEEGVGEMFPLYMPDGIRRAHERAARELAEACAMAERAAGRVEASFRGWRVRSEGCADSPAWCVILKACELKPDLVVGAHGHTLLGGRLILGSVSQKVLYESRCSVRVARAGARRGADAPARIIVGVDGSPGSGAAVEAVAKRAWPAGSEARLACVLDTFMLASPGSREPPALRWVDSKREDDREWVKRCLGPAAERLRGSGLTTAVELRGGNPKHVLVDMAEAWGADSVFVGAKGLRGVERLLLGSVSAAVAARAHCSVEVVRRAEAKGS